MGKDILGGFHIPDHLRAKAAAYVPPTPTPQPKKAEYSGKTKVHLTPSWSTIATYKASKGSSVHTVEARLVDMGKAGEVDLKCSCQGFRIQKKGYCKHTEKATKEYL